MKLISVDAAMATHSVVAEEVKPLKGYFLPEIIHQIGERYALQIIPTVESANKSGARFETGRIRLRNADINIAELSLFNDGFRATTTNTSDSEIVIRDLFSWLQEKHSFREPVTPIFHTYQSDLIVEFDKDPNEKLNFLAPLLSAIQGEMDAVNKGARTPFQFHRVAFAYEGAPKPTEFVLERRAGSPWSSRRYFCLAHVPTDAHIRLLEQMERLLS